MERMKDGEEGRAILRPEVICSYVFFGVLRSLYLRRPLSCQATYSSPLLYANRNIHSHLIEVVEYNRLQTDSVLPQQFPLPGMNLPSTHFCHRFLCSNPLQNQFCQIHCLVHNFAKGICWNWTSGQRIPGMNFVLYLLRFRTFSYLLTRHWTRF